MSKPDFVMQTYIKTSQDRLWDALTGEDSVAHFHFMASHAKKEDDAIVSYMADGSKLIAIRYLSSDPKTRLECAFEPNWMDVPASRVVYMISVERDYCCLTVEHYDLNEAVVAGEGVADGWARWASGLKSWLETGQDTHFGSRADDAA